MRYWLQQDNFTATELSEQVGCVEDSEARVFISRCKAKGLVRSVGRRKSARGYMSEAWEWCGPETIEAVMAQAAARLRETDDATNIQLSDKLFAYLQEGAVTYAAS
jgi:transcription initiation factor IIE alpha subunit